MTPLASSIQFSEFERSLRTQEKASATIEKYLRDLRTFFRWLANNGKDEQSFSNEDIALWKNLLLEKGFAASTINSKLAAINSFCSFIGRPDLHARFLRVQRKVFSDPARDMTRKDYERLLRQAKRENKIQLELVMETICATGMRVSELAYLTVEALAISRIEVRLKGKVRIIFIPERLRQKLLSYLRKQGITQGCVFVNAKGRPLSRFSIWAQMKALCQRAKVVAAKVFPHNLRHLFAKVFYKATKDIVKLADVLGHSSTETTRIYLMSSGKEHGLLINKLGLVI